ncbi:hypothetical protein EKK58_05420 [Candidatus Dependentiae bacterium]|nr:MAG: hypothetical protein EKK58_05420 [Candidatus Dependentiae bacterium]
MKKDTKARGVAKVRDIIAHEEREMQTRAYGRIRPYLVDSLRRLRHAYPAFQTVVFNAEKADFAIIFGDGTRHHEAPKAFDNIMSNCKTLARFSEIEWLTADDAVWQVRRGTPQPERVVEQYRYVHDDAWHFWMRRTLRDARYYMRRDIYSRMVFGAHRPGYGKRITDESGITVDEWIDPVEPMIVRVLRELGPTSLEPLVRKLSVVSGFGDGYHAYYIWDVLQACERLEQQKVLRRLNRKSSEVDAKFAIIE